MLAAENGPLRTTTDHVLDSTAPEHDRKVGPEPRLLPEQGDLLFEVRDLVAAPRADWAERGQHSPASGSASHSPPHSGGMADKNDYVFCVLTEFHRRLRRRDIYAEASSRWRDLRAHLLAGPAWESVRGPTPTALGLPKDPGRNDLLWMVLGKFAQRDHWHQAGI